MMTRADTLRFRAARARMQASMAARAKAIAVARAIDGVDYKELLNKNDRLRRILIIERQISRDQKRIFLQEIADLKNENQEIMHLLTESRKNNLKMRI